VERDASLSSVVEGAAELVPNDAQRVSGLGRSLNEMSQSLGVDRKTIRKYVGPAVAAGVVPGGPAKSEAEWAGSEALTNWLTV
jgi:hypothetical protein